MHGLYKREQWYIECVPEERLQDRIEAAVRQYTRHQTNATRDAIIQICQPLARLLAKRYTHGSPDLFEDLVQMANLGLVKAISDFEPSKEVLFTTYATHKMLGEIRRYLRDKGNHIKLPRRLYEVSPRVQAVKSRLTQELGYEPSVEQIAAASGAPQDIVLEVLQMWYCIEAPSLDAQVTSHGDGPGSVLSDLVGGVDAHLNDLESYADLRHALTQLTNREREIIIGRYFHEMPQAKLAEQLQISQMHVSRLEKKALQELRTILHKGSIE